MVIYVFFKLQTTSLKFNLIFTLAFLFSRSFYQIKAAVHQSTYFFMKFSCYHHPQLPKMCFWVCNHYFYLHLSLKSPVSPEIHIFIIITKCLTFFTVLSIINIASKYFFKYFIQKSLSSCSHCCQITHFLPNNSKVADI